MRKRINLWFVLFCILLSGCSQVDFVPTQKQPATEPSVPAVSVTEPDHTVPEQTQAPAVSQGPMFSIYMPVTTETVCNMDSIVIFSKTYQDVHLIAPEPSVASKISLDLFKRIEGNMTSAPALLQQAANDFIDKTEQPPYSLSTIYTPARLDQNVLSLAGNTVIYNGGSHPVYYNDSANYDMVTGETLVLSDILLESAAFEDIVQLIMEQLETNKASHGLYPNYAAIVNDILRLDFDRYANWYFTQEGLCFFFSPYEIAPYSSGTVAVTVPYSKLLGMLRDAYYPPEQVFDGQIFIEEFNSLSAQAYSQICEVSIPGGTNRYFLHSGQSALGHVKLEQGQWNEEKASFIPTATVLLCATLTPGDAILVELPDNLLLPCLRLSYESCGKTHYWYIHCEPEEGAFLLPK